MERRTSSSPKCLQQLVQTHTAQAQLLTPAASSFRNCLIILGLITLFGFVQPAPAPQTEFSKFGFSANSKVLKRGSDSDSTFNFFGDGDRGITFGSDNASVVTVSEEHEHVHNSNADTKSQSDISFGENSAWNKAPIPGPVSAALILAPGPLPSPSRPLELSQTESKPVFGLGVGVGAQQSVNLSKLCPQISGGVRYDAAERKCGTIGFREHCPENMLFYSFPEDKSFGHCDCIYEAGNQKPFVYNVEAKKCFQIFEQGYCKPGQWITPNPGGDGDPICTRTRCQNIFAGTEKQNSTDFVLYNGECVRLNEPFRSCQQNEIIGFSAGELEPKCRPKIVISTKGVGSIKSLKCSPGTFLSVTGKCQQGWSWD